MLAHPNRSIISIFAQINRAVDNVKIKIKNIYLSNPSTREEYDTRSVFKRSLTGLNSEFSFYTGCLIKTKELSQPNYLLLAGGKITGFIPFPRVLVLSELLSNSFRI